MCRFPCLGSGSPPPFQVLAPATAGGAVPPRPPCTWPCLHPWHVGCFPTLATSSWISCPPTEHLQVPFRSDTNPTPSASCGGGGARATHCFALWLEVSLENTLLAVTCLLQRELTEAQPSEWDRCLASLAIRHGGRARTSHALLSGLADQVSVLNVDVMD